MFNSIPGPGDQCHCGSYYACYCQAEPDPEDLFEEAYERGFNSCQDDGYGEHPLFWMSVTGEAEAALARDWRHLCTDGTITDTRGQTVYSSHVFHYSRRAWPYPFRWNPLSGECDPESFLAGWDDAGAGLPSAVRDPEGHAIHAKALDDCEPWALERQPDLSDTPLGPWPARSEVALCEEFELPF